MQCFHAMLLTPNSIKNTHGIIPRDNVNTSYIAIIIILTKRDYLIEIDHERRECNSD